MKLKPIKIGLDIQQDQPDYTLPLILEKTGIDTSKFVSIDPYKITYEEFIKRQEAGEAVKELVRELGITEQTFYTWKRKYAGLGVTELRKLKQQDEEIARLKRLVADLMLDKQMLQEVVAKKF